MSAYFDISKLIRVTELIEVHNSRRPLNCLTTLTLTFCLIFIGGQGIMMDSPCAKFGDFTLSRFSFIVRTDRQNHRDRSMLYSRDYRRRE